MDGVWATPDGAGAMTMANGVGATPDRAEAAHGATSGDRCWREGAAALGSPTNGVGTTASYLEELATSTTFDGYKGIQSRKSQMIRGGGKRGIRTLKKHILHT
jgi:hypothetical protein